MTGDQNLRPGVDSFDALYRGALSTEIPWDIGQAQPRLMELEALGGIAGEVLDMGCGLGDNAIFLAARGHSVTGLDGSPTGIERARNRAADAGVTVQFAVADATDLTGYEGRFDTVVDSALYHCLDEGARQSYAAGLYRATRPGARWHLWCFSDASINGITAPMAGVSQANIRDTLTANGWRIDFLGPATYLANPRAFTGDGEWIKDLPAGLRQLVDGDQAPEWVHLPFTVVHAHRVD